MASLSLSTYKKNQPGTYTEKNFETQDWKGLILSRGAPGSLKGGKAEGPSETQSFLDTGSTGCTED
jgi:hypothetical protein